MADLSRGREGEILKGVFEVLANAPDGLEAKKVIAELENRMELTPFEDAEYPKRPGVRRFPKIVRFTTINAVKAGWLVKDSGTWSLTDDGLAALRKYTDPKALMLESIRLYNQWAKEQTSGNGQPPPSDDAEAAERDEPAASLTLEEAQEEALSEIRTHLQEMDAYDFQDLVAGLLRGMGYHVTWVAPRGADGGLDILAQSDPLGTNGPRIKGQVKRRQEKANVEDIRSFISLLGTHDVGVFVALAGFTRDAESVARQQETRRLTLINLSTLLQLWIDHQTKIEEADRQLLPLTPVYYLSPTA